MTSEWAKLLLSVSDRVGCFPASTTSLQLQHTYKSINTHLEEIEQQSLININSILLIRALVAVEYHVGQSYWNTNHQGA